MAKKRSKKKNRKSRKLSIVLIVILVLIIICLGGFLGYKYYNISSVALPLIPKMEEEINISQEATNDLSFPKTMEGYENITIDWKTSDSKVINTEGKVTRPSYTTGDKLITINATYNICKDNKIAEIVWKLLKVESIEYTYKVYVPHLEATNEEKMNITIASLYVPDLVNSPITLRTKMEMFPDVSIVWTTDDSNIITNNGEINNSGTTTLKAKIGVGEEEKEVSFSIEVTDDDIITIADNQTFDAFPNGTYTNGLDTGENGWNVFSGKTFIWEDEEAIGEERFVVLNANKSLNGSLSMNYDVEDITKITFYYQLNEASNYVADNTYVDLFYSVDSGENYILLESIPFIDKNEYVYEKDIDITGKIRFKIVGRSNSGEYRIDIDDLYLYRKINENDVKEWVEKNTITNVTNDYPLPVTTMYGGKITWESNNEVVMNSKGIIKRTEESQNVVMTATITGLLNKAIAKEVEITIAGYASKTPVEIYFIDLGKYGQSDCGESIYIKAANFDILIDAGDRFETSNKAIEEVLNNYSEDKVIDYIIATHPDSDHIGGMSKIFTDYEVLNLLQFVGDHKTEIYRNYKASYEAEGLNSICTASESVDNNQDVCSSTINIIDGVTLTIIDTKHYDNYEETNDRSVVTILEAYGTRVLLTGDADNKADSNLEASYMASVGDIDVLKAVHHATKNGTTSEFLASVDPEMVIICNGNYFGNKHGHPTPEAISRIYQYDSKINIYAVVGGDATSDSCSYSSSYKCELSDPMVDRNGTITLTIDENGYKVSSEYFGDNPLELSQTTFWKQMDSDYKTSSHID